jgi:Fibronectin type III domain
MSDLTKQQYFSLWTRVAETVHMPLRLTAIVTGLLLLIMPLLTGCGDGQTGSQSPVTVAPGSAASATASLAWSPVTDPSVSAYFVHYGRQSPGQEGSCTYESSIIVDSSSATVVNLHPHTLYYFTVSAYNGLESACSNEVSIITAPPSITAAVNEGAPPTLSPTGTL